jgi:hypothetical protein
LSSSHRYRISLAALGSAGAFLALSAPAFAQPAAPIADCLKTETQAECHTRLKCRADEELEACKKRRAQAVKEGRDPDRNEGGGKRGDRDDDDDDKKPGERKDRDDDDDKKPGERKDRDDDDDKKPRQRRDRDDDDKKPAQRRDRDRDRDRDDEAKARRDRDDDDDDGGGRGGGGGGGRGILRPGTRPFFFSGGIGPSWGFCYRGDCDPGRLDYSTFYGTLDFGYHFSGNFEGPAIGANIHGGYGSFGPFDHGRFGAGFKFWWDIRVADDHGVYLTPFAQAGWSSFIFDDRRFLLDDTWEHFFNVQFGMQIKLILGNRGLVYIQPVTFDNVINSDGYGLLYHFEIGGGVTFGN